MEFNKRYNRNEFVNFLQNKFLPEDFIVENTTINSNKENKYITEVTKLGHCSSLDLVVYEARHTSTNDARVGLSKETFRFLANEWESRALVLFVPKDDDKTYRFSLITIDLEETENGKLNKIYSNPRRYSYLLGEGIAYYTPNKYLNESGRVKDDKDLTDRFSVEVLTKAFYQELSDWYAWAVKEIRFPNKLHDTTDDTRYNHEAAIRLVTRLIFVWFLKQKNLIPNEFFDEEFISEKLLKDFHPNQQIGLFGHKSLESKYYKAILQNLFFAMLNSPITKEGESELSERHFRSGRGDYDNNKLMRYESMFKNPQLFIDLANKTVPFLNGGLFDCLDDKDNGNYVDGFSDRDVVKNALIVPDFLFFGDEVGKNIDLSEWYGDKNKKKVSARGIIDILKRYNFTVEENTPFDQEVSLDPELLGKVFENLLASYNPETQTTARKQTGSFYTPREIVQYMVDESLISHLNRKVGSELESEYRKLTSYTDEEINLTKEQKVKIMHAIYQCKVLDPACGSGAFPVGLLQQMVHMLSKLDPTNEQWKEMLLDDAERASRSAFQSDSKEEREERLKDIENAFDENLNNPDYARKLFIIENCIYGVDIQPIAIQISKLRFFISLVVDQKSNNDPAKNFGIRPLPNLEAKFVSANTLIPLPKAENNLGRTDEIIKLENLLKEANHKIFNAKTVRTKRKWKERLIELREDMKTKLVENGFLTRSAAELMVSWDMFNQNTSATYFDSDWMFGIKNGFDIVIGNPPYIQLQSNGGELAKLYEDYNYQTFAKTGDIYCLFYEKGWELLNNSGHLCYITSNKWMRAGYGEKTRGFLAKNTNPKYLIDFAGVKIFENATVDTNILIFSKEQNEHQTRCIVTDKLSKDSLKKLSDFVLQQHTICNFSNEESWVILSPIEQSIKQKIESVGTPLKDWDIKIYRGVLTGYNDAFIISTEKRDEILANCQTEDERLRTAELIRPILRGRDIKRYGYDWANLWIINTHNGIKGVKPRIDVNEYPAVKAHLDQYWDKISKRADKGDTPYNLRNCAYLEDFFKPKVMWKRIGSIIRFSYSDNNIFGLDSTCFAIGRNIEYLCCILNSPMGHYLLKDAPKTGTGDLLVSVQAVDPIRIPIITEEQNKLFSNLLINLIKNNFDSEIEEINNTIFKLYNLSYEEQRYIMENFM